MSGKAKAWTSVKQQNNKDADSIYQAPPVPQDNSIGNSMGSTIEMVLALAASAGAAFAKRRIFIWLGVFIATHAICTTSALFPSSGQSPMMGLFFLLTQFTNTYKDLFIMPAVTPVIAQAPSQTPT